MQQIGTINHNEAKINVFKTGKELIPGFNIDPFAKQVYAALHNYFHGIEGEIDLNKGIALVGKFGVGKTTAMRVFHNYLKIYFPFHSNLFVFSTLEDLISELKCNDWTNKKLTYNLKETPSGGLYKDPRHVLINEFGHSYNIKSYGSDVNELIEAWIMKRYDIFQEHRKVVHITSNYGKKDLKEMFSEKLVDRFKEMFHFVELKGESKRS